jgi:hypothetical protein
MAFGHFSDIAFVSAGYAPRAKSVVFAGCAPGKGRDFCPGRVAGWSQGSFAEVKSDGLLA